MCVFFIILQYSFPSLYANAKKKHRYHDAVLERSNSQVSYNYFNKEAAAIFKESDPNICGMSLGDTMVSVLLFNFISLQNYINEKSKVIYKNILQLYICYYKVFLFRLYITYYK